ncbi:PREDICTED: uncharacterized protein LOC109221386 [Nicotiana attenuata]|uniref:uncharacterized protein LOC109221386 n=1 Tax=Nicotiana attenuata TaxID=49451 RepID=UPI000905037D|nr:PREDICTED: uncharacterized protein LOC109221386 [Nicotiana attenuata]
MTKILHNGPWFINGFFLSIQKWVPNFIAKEAHQSYTTVWVRLPQLPTEFYDGIILSRIGNCIGKLLKVDACTSATLRGRYVRLCVELPPEQPVQNYLLIGQHKQLILYEGDDILCKACGKLGHTSLRCSQATLPTKQKADQSDIEPPLSKTDQAGEWMTVSFPKKGKSKATNQQKEKAGKYLNTQPLSYINKQFLTNIPNNLVSTFQSDPSNEPTIVDKTQVAKPNDKGESSLAKPAKQHKEPNNVSEPNNLLLQRLPQLILRAG